MSLLDPRELLHEVLDRYVAWSILISMAIGAAAFVLYLVVTFWPFFLGLGLGIPAGYVWHSRRGW